MRKESLYELKDTVTVSVKVTVSSSFFLTVRELPSLDSELMGPLNKSENPVSCLSTGQVTVSHHKVRIILLIITVVQLKLKSRRKLLKRGIDIEKYAKRCKALSFV